SGKTSTGKILARRLGYRLMDTDRFLEEQTGMKIRTIFRKHGEVYFRALESRLCRRIPGLKKIVVATGGGIVLNPDNMKNLGKNGLIVNLRASPDVLWLRVRHKKNRPLLNVEEPSAVLKKLWKQRKPFYDRADLIIRTDALSVAQTADKIISLLMKRYGFPGT
ncbi:MAG: shikimate kinase, partial [bacterium]|nr:shikimate kinase [bacterium]